MTVVQSLFPSAVACVFSDRPPSNFDLLAAETDATRNMRATRLREFVHGRACARQALADLGFPECAVPVGEDRAPVWPDGIVGSISHSDNHATAVVVRSTDHQGLGVDLEVNEPLEASLLPMLCRPEELARLGQPATNPALPKIVFSAKESVFKCIWPMVRRFVDFQEIEIRIDIGAGSFVAIPHTENLPHALIKKIRGRYVQSDKLIITGAYV